MRNAMTAAVGLAIFFGTACGSGNNGTTGSSTGPAQAAGSGTSSGGAGSATNGGSVTGGTTTGPSKLKDGVACTSNSACQSGVCGLDGTGNCCTETCKTDTALCAASACAPTTDKDPGSCTYTNGTACNSTCQYGMFTGSVCNNGACSPGGAVACPTNLACNSQGTACQGSCNTANGAADCSPGWYCANEPTGPACAPQIQLGACAANAECMSNVCGVNGTGHCCTQTACTNTTAPCGTADCDGATGQCTFPPSTVSCASGAVSCSGQHTSSNPNTTCDGMGDCQAPIEMNCSPYACDVDAGGCLQSCSTLSDCAKDFYCSGGNCIPQNAVGPCTENDSCLSLQCGANGTGDCCFQACASTDPSCGITSCDPVDGSCNYPGGTQTCGTIKESCSTGIQQNPSICDGQGNCPPPPTTNCYPYVCGATSCLASCTKSSDCTAATAYCDKPAAECCPVIQSNGTLNVDGANGSDTAACCGLPGYTECQTIAMAMSLIDSAQAQNVTINAYIGGAGNGGDWPYAQNQESIPITLGWGAELVAPTVNFGPDWFNLGENNYSNTAYPEIFDITQYSANDPLASASIVGTAADGPVQIGYSQSQGNDYYCFQNAGIQVETGAHLYLANANVFSDWYYIFYAGDNWWNSYGSQSQTNAAINVAPGGHLTLGKDEANNAANGGTVTIGVQGSSSGYDEQYHGWNGIVCQSDEVSQGCTIDDAPVAAGTSSLIIASMWHQDIDAEDFANITLNSAPQFGTPPSATGFYKCPYKEDAYCSGNGSAPLGNYCRYGQSCYSNVPSCPTTGVPAIWLNGQVTMTLKNPTIQCVAGDGIAMNASAHGFGTPTLTISGATIQNTERAIYASAGTATVSNSTIEYNYNGVEEDTDGTNSSTIDLSGGTAGGTNTVICTSAEESQEYNSCKTGCTPAVNVLNTTSSNLNATNVVWDTKTPDEFQCDSTLTSCTCEVAACTNAGGIDNMDAVYTGSGTVTTKNPGLSTASCTPPKICNGSVCQNGTTCCDWGAYECYGVGVELSCYPNSECSNGFYIGYESCYG